MNSSPQKQGDPCETIRAEFDANQADILTLEEALNDDDILESIKARFRVLLERRKQEQRGLNQALIACESRVARVPGELVTDHPVADRSDPCGPISEQLARVDDEFFAATQELSQHDLSPERRAELEAVVMRCRDMQILLLRALAVCQNRPERPIEA